MVSGVFMKATKAGEAKYPMTIRISPMTKVVTREVWIEARRARLFLAPKYWETTTLAPVEKPTKRPTSVLTAGPTEVTAPRASALTAGSTLA